MKKQKAFTLIELLVVLTIIGLLMAYLAPKLGVFQDKAKSTTISSDLKSTFDNAINLSTLTNKRLPTESELVKQLADFNNGTVTFANGTADIPVTGVTYSRVALVYKDGNTSNNGYYICIKDANTLHIVSAATGSTKQAVAYTWVATAGAVTCQNVTSKDLEPPPPKLYLKWTGLPDSVDLTTTFPYQAIIKNGTTYVLFETYLPGKLQIYGDEIQLWNPNNALKSRAYVLNNGVWEWSAGLSATSQTILYISGGWSIVENNFVVMDPWSNPVKAINCPAP